MPNVRTMRSIVSRRGWIWACAWGLAWSAAGQAVLPTSHSGPWSNNALLPAGWTQTNLTEYAMNYDGAGGGAAKFDSSNDVLRIDLSGTPEEVTYWIQHNMASGYVFRVEESADGAAWTDVATYAGSGIPGVAQPRTNLLLAASRHVRFRYETKTIGNIGLDGVVIRGWPTNFCVMFDRRDGFSVQTNAAATIVATAHNGAEPYEVAWDSTLGAEHWSASGATFTIEASAPRGDYVAWATATDSSDPVQTATNAVRFAVTTVYAIVLAPATHGTLATEPAGYAAGGETVLVLDAPEAGYQLAALTVEPDGGDPFALNGGRFAMPATATTVRAVFEEIPPAGSYVVDFEDGDKFTYPAANVVLNGKMWELEQALISTDINNVIAGFKSARLRDGTNAPALTLLEDLTNGLGRLSFKYRAAASVIDPVDWQAEYSRDGGASWVRIGRPFAPPAHTVVQFFSRGVHVAGPVRVRIVRGSTNLVEASRLLVDDLVATPYDGLGPALVEDAGPGPAAGDYEVEMPGGYGLARVEGTEPGLSGCGPWSNLTEGVHYGVSNATVTVWTIPGARQWLRFHLVPLP